MPSSANRTMMPIEWAMLALLSVLWGGSFFFTGVALEQIPPLTLVVLRVGLAALVLNMVVPAVGLRMPRDRKTWAAFFGMGFLNNAVPFCLIVWDRPISPRDWPPSSMRRRRSRPSSSRTS